MFSRIKNWFGRQKSESPREAQPKYRSVSNTIRKFSNKLNVHSNDREWPYSPKPEHTKIRLSQGCKASQSQETASKQRPAQVAQRSKTNVTKPTRKQSSRRRFSLSDLLVNAPKRASRDITPAMPSDYRVQPPIKRRERAVRSPTRYVEHFTQQAEKRRRSREMDVQLTINEQTDANKHTESGTNVSTLTVKRSARVVQTAPIPRRSWNVCTAPEMLGSLPLAHDGDQDRFQRISPSPSPYFQNENNDVTPLAAHNNRRAIKAHTHVEEPDFEALFQQEVRIMPRALKHLPDADTTDSDIEGRDEQGDPTDDTMKPYTSCCGVDTIDISPLPEAQVNQNMDAIEVEANNSFFGDRTVHESANAYDQFIHGTTSDDDGDKAYEAASDSPATVIRRPREQSIGSDGTDHDIAFSDQVDPGQLKPSYNDLMRYIDTYREAVELFVSQRDESVAINEVLMKDIASMRVTNVTMHQQLEHAHRLLAQAHTITAKLRNDRLKACKENLQLKGKLDSMEYREGIMRIQMEEIRRMQLTLNNIELHNTDLDDPFW